MRALNSAIKSVSFKHQIKLTSNQCSKIQQCYNVTCIKFKIKKKIFYFKVKFGSLLVSFLSLIEILRLWLVPFLEYHPHWTVKIPKYDKKLEQVDNHELGVK